MFLAWTSLQTVKVGSPGRRSKEAASIVDGVDACLCSPGGCGRVDADHPRQVQRRGKGKLRLEHDATGCAYYCSGAIHLAPRASYPPEEYYSTFFHELGHYLDCELHFPHHLSSSREPIGLAPLAASPALALPHDLSSSSSSSSSPRGVMGRVAPLSRRKKLTRTRRRTSGWGCYRPRLESRPAPASSDYCMSWFKALKKVDEPLNRSP